MTKRKTRRSRCVNESCQKQFRHADPAAQACSSNCKQVLYRIRRKAREEAEQERERTEKYARFLAAVRKRDELEQAERQAAEREREAAARQAEEERRRSQPRPKPASEPDDRGRGMMLGGMWISTEPEQTITITRTMPVRPTPLYNRRR